MITADHLLAHHAHDIDPCSYFCDGCGVGLQEIIDLDLRECAMKRVRERSNKVASGELPAAWLAVSQPFGLADNAPTPSRAMDASQPHGLDVRRQAYRDWTKSMRFRDFAKLMRRQ
jgi:hypothetical protein